MKLLKEAKADQQNAKIINGFGKILFQVQDMSKQEIWTETKNTHTWLYKSMENLQTQTLECK